VPLKTAIPPVLPSLLPLHGTTGITPRLHHANSMPAGISGTSHARTMPVVCGGRATDHAGNSFRVKVSGLGIPRKGIGDPK